MFHTRMQKAWLAGLLLMLGLGLSGLAHAESNLLDNPGFENGATGWQVWSTAANALADPAIVTDAAAAHGGSKFAQLDWTASESFMAMSQDVDTAAKAMTPGKDYFIRMWCKTSAITADSSVRINFTNVVGGGSAYLYSDGVTGPQSAWTEHIFSVKLPTDQSTHTTYQLQVSPNLKAAGTVYVDDCALVDPLAGGAGNLLLNAGFEDGALGWQVWSSAANVLSDPAIVADAAQAHGGSKFARIDWVDAESFMSLAQEVDTAALGMTPGNDYVIRMWYKTSAIRNANSVRINFTNVVAGGSAYLNSAGIAGTQSAWTEQTFSFKQPTDQTVNTYQVQINPTLSVAGTVYVDDCSLAAPGTGGPEGNLLDNAGFEAGATGWQVWSSLANANSAPPVTTDAAAAHEGSKFAQVAWDANESYLILYRSIDSLAKGMVKGNDYTISAWYKTAANFPVDRAVQLCFTNTPDGGSFWFNSDGIQGPQSAWTKQEMTITLPTDQVKNVYNLQVRPVAEQIDVAGTLYVDDCALTVPVLPPNLCDSTWQEYK